MLRHSCGARFALLVEAVKLKKRSYVAEPTPAEAAAAKRAAQEVAQEGAAAHREAVQEKQRLRQELLEEREALKRAARGEGKSCQK